MIRAGELYTAAAMYFMRTVWQKLLFTRRNVQYAGCVKFSSLHSIEAVVVLHLSSDTLLSFQLM